MKKILIIDDSATVRVALERILAQRSLEVLSASTGLAAIARMLEESPDLILCDLALPDRDGVSILRFVRNHPVLTRTPFFIVSGAGDDEAERQALSAGCSGIVHKPVSADALLALVDGALGAPPVPASGSPARILVVDDSMSVRVAVERILARNGYRTTSVASGEAALEVLARETFDLVISDLVMPGLDGIGVLRAVKESERHRSTPVLLISGLGDAQLVESARAAGCDGLVAKPFSPETLLPKVESLLGRTAPVAPAPAPVFEAPPPEPPAPVPSAVPEPVRAVERESARVLGALPGTEWAVLVEADGSLIESDGRTFEGGMTAAIRLAGLSAPLWDLGDSAGKGALRSALLQYRSGFLALFVLPSGRLLLASLADVGQLGLLRLAVERRLPKLLADVR